jgi:hypothetical protein
MHNVIPNSPITNIHGASDCEWSRACLAFSRLYVVTTVNAARVTTMISMTNSKQCPSASHCGWRRADTHTHAHIHTHTHTHTHTQCGTVSTRSSQQNHQQIHTWSMQIATHNVLPMSVDPTSIGVYISLRSNKVYCIEHI